MNSQGEGMKTKLYSSMPARGIRNTIVVAIASLLAVASAGWTATPSELLEQGIYQEETKGDLDAALKLYQQALDEAKNVRAVAAQAQFRVGICQFKKGDSAAANASFEQVIKEFPDQKETVAQAHDYLYQALHLLPAPWVEGEALHLELRNPAGVKRGSILGRMTSAEVNGQKIWRLDGRVFVHPSRESLMRVEVDAATMKPLRSVFRNRAGREMETVYRPGVAETKVNGVSDPKLLPLTGAVYDGDEIAMLLQRLPLKVNYSVTLSRADLDPGNSTRTVYTETASVLGVDQVQVPAGNYECFRIRTMTNLTSWISTDPHHYFVKWAFDDGARAELASISQQRPGEPVQYEDPVYHFALTAPSGWDFDRYLGTDAANNVKALTGTDTLSEDQARTLTVARDYPKSEAVLNILSTNLDHYCEVNVGRMEDLDANAQTSPRVWAEAGLVQLGQVSGLKIRPDSWQELKLAGCPAATAIGYLGQGVGNPTVYAAWIFDGPNVVKLYFATFTSDFETMRPVFEGIVRSYRHSQ